MTTHHVPRGSVVVGVDGSVPSDRAVTWAAEQARLERRPLALVHGVPSAELWLDSYGIDRAQVVDAIRSEARATLERVRVSVEEDFPDLTVCTELRLADPRVVLLDLAVDAAMLVVGSRGRGPVASLVLGSVSAAISRHAPCPVVVLRDRATDVGAGVLVGVDSLGHSTMALEFAFRQAAARRVPLTVLHCFFDVVSTTRGPDLVPYDTPGLEDQRLLIDESVAGLREKYPDVDVTLLLGRGLVDDRLRAASAGADMLVLGAPTGRRLLSVLLDPRVDRALVTSAPCSLAIVPEPAAH